MKAGVLLFVLSSAKEYMVAKGHLLTDGTIVNMDNLQDDLGLVAVIETSLKEHGVNTPDKIDKVIKALPLIFSFVQ